MVVCQRCGKPTILDPYDPVEYYGRTIYGIDEHIGNFHRHCYEMYKAELEAKLREDRRRPLIVLNKKVLEIVRRLYKGE